MLKALTDDPVRPPGCTDTALWSWPSCRVHLLLILTSLTRSQQAAQLQPGRGKRGVVRRPSSAGRAAVQLHSRCSRLASRSQWLQH